MNTRIINLKTNQEDHIPIDRGTRWGNPYRIGIDGTRDEVIVMFEDDLRGNPVLMADLPKLRGQVLGCYCWPKRCHGDVIIKLLKEMEC